MDIKKWKRAQFFALPKRAWQMTAIASEIVLLPSRLKHDSGYLLMDAAVFGEGFEPFRSGLSDHFMFYPGLGWEMDLLPGSGLFRVWRRGPFKIGMHLSTVEFGDR